MKKTLLACLIAVALSACGGGGGGGGAPDDPAAPATPPAPAHPVVFLGDSITAFWHVGDCVPGAANAGIPGNTTAQLQARYPDHIAPLNASKLILLGGTNDIEQEAAPTTDSLYAVAATAKNAGAQVIIGTIPPWGSPGNTAVLEARVVVWNAAVTAMATTYGFTLVDYFAVLVKPDGTQDETLFNADLIHPNQAGYDKMCTALRAVL